MHTRKSKESRWISMILGLILSTTALAQPLGDLVTVEDGLDPETPENSQDDVIRLTLLNPSYATAAAIKKAVEDWLGPDMVTLQSQSLILIQAPRDPNLRVNFIAALLALEF